MARQTVARPIALGIGPPRDAADAHAPGLHRGQARRLTRLGERGRRRGRALRIGLAAACAIGLACSPEAPDPVVAASAAPANPDAAASLVVDARLVDLAHAGTAFERLPHATLNHDRRVVLRRPASSDWEAVDLAAEIDPDEPISVWLPEAYRDTAGVEARLLAIGQGAEVFGVENDTAMIERATLRFRAPDALRGQDALVQLRVEVDSTTPPQPIAVPATEIPPAAELRFAIAGVAGATTSFEIEACRRGACERVFDELVIEGGGWLRRRVSLDDLAGETVQLRFSSAVAAPDGPDPIAREGLWANPTILARGPRPTDAAADLAAVPENVVIVSLDTLGAKHLGTYGARRDTSPFLDRFFDERGLVVERFIASEVHTSPSHMSLFTSLPPTTHGVHAGRMRRLAYGVDTLAVQLRQTGRATAAFTENVALTAGSGIERGFDVYREVRRREGEVGIVDTFAAGRAWLDTHADRPFFLFLHTYETHWRYEPPAPYDALFEGDGIDDDPRLGEQFSLTRHEQEIALADHEVERLIEKLDALAVLGRTLVVVTSDHGEEFLEHGHVGHGVHLTGEVLRVPLLVAGPGVPRGERRRGPMAQIDLAPTLLDLLGAPALEDAMGSSVLAWWQGDAPAPDRPAFSEAWFPSARSLSDSGEVQKLSYTGPRYAITTTSHRLVERTDAEGMRGRRRTLRALGRDPAEERDIAGDAPRVTHDLALALDAHMAEAQAMHEALLDRERALVRAGGASSIPELDDERVRGLRELGYIE